MALPKPKLSVADLHLVLAHPAVPPLNTTQVSVTLPAAPKLVKVLKASTPTYLRTLYSSAATRFWPIQDASTRGKVSNGVLLGAGDIFKASGVPPAVYLEWAFRRASVGKARRRSPILPQVVFDPAIVEESLNAVNLAGTELVSSASSVYDAPYLRDLALCTRWLQREAQQLSKYDAAAVQALADTVFPQGWIAEYEYAKNWAAAKQLELDAAAAAGTFIWPGV